MKTYFTIFNSELRTPRLSETQTGEPLATLFETESDAAKYVAQLADRDSLTVGPTPQNIPAWLQDRKSEGVKEVYVQPKDAPSFTNSIEMFSIFLRGGLA